MNGLPRQTILNIIPLGSYDFLINMYWLADHKSKLDFYNNNLECEYEEGKKRTLQEVHKSISVR